MVSAWCVSHNAAPITPPQMPTRRALTRLNEPAHSWIFFSCLSPTGLKKVNLSRTGFPFFCVSFYWFSFSFLFPFSFCPFSFYFFVLCFPQKNPQTFFEIIKKIEFTNIYETQDFFEIANFYEIHEHSLNSWTFYKFCGIFWIHEELFLVNIFWNSWTFSKLLKVY